MALFDEPYDAIGIGYAFFKVLNTGQCLDHQVQVIAAVIVFGFAMGQEHKPFSELDVDTVKILFLNRRCVNGRKINKTHSKSDRNSALKCLFFDQNKRLTGNNVR